MKYNNVIKTYEMRVNDLEQPLGIACTAPVFSWKTHSQNKGWLQEAYRIVLKTSDSIVWDSGKILSGVTNGIICGTPLIPCTEYTWQVSVWGRDGSTYTSPESSFETGLPAKDPFGKAKWISCAYHTISTDTSYTIEFDFKIVSESQGFSFGMKDKRNFFMWQVNPSLSDRILLRPHQKKNGTWTVLGEAADITDAIGCSAKELPGKLIRERIEVNGKTVKTYFGKDGAPFKLASEYTHTEDIPLNCIGFRNYPDIPKAKAITEYGNIIITDKNGNVIYKNDFSDNNTGFFGYPQCLNGGMLRVGNKLAAGELVFISTSKNALPVFRKTADVRKDLVSARLYTSGLGVYETYINGERPWAGEKDGEKIYAELKPGFTEMKKRKFYNSFDVTEILRKGEKNAVSAVVSHSWWSDGAVAQHFEEDAYLAKLVLKYADGSVEEINTDESWKSEFAAPTVYSDIFEGEIYDARTDVSWMQPEYNDESWRNTFVNTSFNGIICPWSGSFIYERRDLERKAEKITVYSGATGSTEEEYGKINILRTEDSDSFTLLPGETVLIDFGQNFSGREAFTARGERGTVLTIEHGEILNDNNGSKARGNDGPEGSVYNLNYRSAKAATVYTFAGSGRESYSPEFTFYGFRYIEMTASAPVTFYSVTGRVITSVEKETGDITTSDSSVNKLISNIRWGQYSNYLSLPTDCPQRDERQGWTADTQVFAKAGCYLAFSKSFLSKFTCDMRDSQHENGAFPGTSPTGRYRGAGWGGTGWADAGIIIPHLLYRMYGDKSIITENMEAMRHYVDGFLGTTEGFGPKPIWGDWLAYESNDAQIKEILGVAFYAWDALMMAEMAEITDNAALAEEYRALYEKQKQFFISRYLNEEKKLIRGEQSVCVYALFLDLLPDEEAVKNVILQLTSNIERNGNRLQTGFLGTAILLPTLTKIGRDDLAYSLLLQHENPSWLYSVDQGATTIWERWNSYTIANGFGDVGMNSFNHYAYGAVAAWMFETALGIAPTSKEPAFKKTVISPRPDKRLSVCGKYDSPYGVISASSSFEGDKWIYACSTPANTTADITIPVQNIENVTVNGKKVKDLTLEADGITFTSCNNNFAEFTALSGDYVFNATV